MLTCNLSDKTISALTAVTWDRIQCIELEHYTISEGLHRFQSYWGNQTGSETHSPTHSLTIDRCVDVVLFLENTRTPRPFLIYKFGSSLRYQLQISYMSLLLCSGQEPLHLKVICARMTQPFLIQLIPRWWNKMEASPCVVLHCHIYTCWAVDELPMKRWRGSLGMDATHV